MVELKLSKRHIFILLRFILGEIRIWMGYMMFSPFRITKSNINYIRDWQNDYFVIKKIWMELQ